MEKFKMSLANVPGKLSRAEMKHIMAGTRTDDDPGGGHGTCYLRCDKTKPDGIEVSDCSRATMEANCDGATTPVCIC
jgi:hypothetical protein